MVSDEHLIFNATDVMGMTVVRFEIYRWYLRKSNSEYWLLVPKFYWTLPVDEIIPLDQPAGKSRH